MSNGRKTKPDIVDENIHLRAQVAQLEDRLDHLAAHGKGGRGAQDLELLHRTVLSVVSDAVLISDDAGWLVYVSPNVHFIFGHAQEDVLQQGRIDYLLPPGLFDPEVLERRGEISNLECQLRDSLGRARDLLITVRQVELKGGTRLYTCRDVTERKTLARDLELMTQTLEWRVEEQTQELRESRERYRRLVEGLRHEYLFYSSDAKSIITYISPAVYTILGYLPEEVIGHNWREFVDPVHPLLAELERHERLRFAALPSSLMLAPIKHADGETRLLEFRDSVVCNNDGQVIANEGIARDVTQRLKDEEELRRAHEELERHVEERTAALTATNELLRDNEQRYRSVVEDHPEFIVRWQGNGMRTFVNEAYCKYMNSTRDELIGTSFMPTIVEEDCIKLKELLDTVSIDNPVVVDEQRVVRPDGRVVWQRWSHRALFNEHGKLIEYQAVGSDVTERRKLEQHARDQAIAEVKVRNLSAREYDVMRLVVAGNANKVIARKLGLSIKTIEKHRSSLMRKLEVRSVPELVRLALLGEEAGRR